MSNKKLYAKDFDPSTRVVELCRYSNAVERIAELEAAEKGYHEEIIRLVYENAALVKQRAELEAALKEIMDTDPLYWGFQPATTEAQRIAQKALEGNQ